MVVAMNYQSGRSNLYICVLRSIMYHAPFRTRLMAYAMYMIYTWFSYPQIIGSLCSLLRHAGFHCFINKFASSHTSLIYLAICGARMIIHTSSAAATDIIHAVWWRAAYTKNCSKGIRRRDTTEGLGRRITAAPACPVSPPERNGGMVACCDIMSVFGSFLMCQNTSGLILVHCTYKDQDSISVSYYRYSSNTYHSFQHLTYHILYGF